MTKDSIASGVIVVLCKPI